MSKKENLTFKATLARLDMGEATRWKLQKYLARNKQASIYQISKDLDWSVGKTQSGLRRLKNLGVVRNEKRPQDGRIYNLFSLMPVESLLKR